MWSHLRVPTYRAYGGWPSCCRGGVPPLSPSPACCRRSSPLAGSGDGRQTVSMDYRYSPNPSSSEKKNTYIQNKKPAPLLTPCFSPEPEVLSWPLAPLTAPSFFPGTELFSWPRAPILTRAPLLLSSSSPEPRAPLMILSSSPIPSSSADA